jgi:hypothetical protein
MIKSEVLKYLIPSIGTVYFTSYMTYMIGITEGKTKMYNSVLERYTLTLKKGYEEPVKNPFMAQMDANVIQSYTSK